jgi:hypothetical protein
MNPSSSSPVNTPAYDFRTNPENNPLLSPYGAPIGLITGQQERVEELNMRIMERNYPDVDLQPNFSPRPVMTKYTLLSMIDQHKKPTVKIQPYLDYYPEVMFHPGNSRGPVSGYFNRVDVENELRSQTRPLVGHDDMKQQYIPSVNGDMYNVKVLVSESAPLILGNQCRKRTEQRSCSTRFPTTTKNPVEQTHPLLFSPFTLETSKTNLEGKPVGTDRFNNHTRTQVRCL